MCRGTPYTMPDFQQIEQDYRRGVPGTEEYAFAITPLDRTGLPVWNVVRYAPNGEMIVGIGYGDTDARACVGAWGELMEQSASLDACRRLPRTRASYDELRRQGRAAVDPLMLRLPVGIDYSHDRELIWLPATRWADKAEVLVPIEAVGTHFYDLPEDDDTPFPLEPMFTPISNGNGAGDTLERAVAHGLQELLQRDGNSAGYRAVERGTVIELDQVQDAETRKLLSDLDHKGIEVIAKLADVTCGMASLYVVGHEREPGDAPHPIMLTGCGEAAHPDREAALNKAVKELCASRVRKWFTFAPFEAIRDLFPPGYYEKVSSRPPPVEESASFEGVLRWMSLDAGEIMDRMRPTNFLRRDTVKFSHIPSVDFGAADAVEDNLRLTLDMIEDERKRQAGAGDDPAGYDVLVIDFTPLGSPVHACKIIVPRLEVETMTYRRVGPRNLRRLIDRGFDFVGLGDVPAGAQRVPMDPAGERWLGGPAWYDPAKADARIADLDLYPMYREPEIHALALHEAAEG